MTKSFAYLLLIGALAAPVTLTAQSAVADEPLRVDDPTPGVDPEKLEELSREAEEAIAKLLELMEPLMASLADLVSDLPRYEAPEMLPNGDIIIRRKRDDAFERPIEETETDT